MARQLQPRQIELGSEIFDEIGRAAGPGPLQKHRRHAERRLLDHYHAVLLAHGVAGYDRRALDEDYRLSVLWQLTTPVWQAFYDIPPWIWWNYLERIFAAVDDLGCRELLQA